MLDLLNLIKESMANFDLLQNALLDTDRELVVKTHKTYSAWNGKKARQKTKYKGGGSSDHRGYLNSIRIAGKNPA